MLPRLTYDGSGFDGVHHLLQCPYVWVIVSKLLFLMVQVAPPLKCERFLFTQVQFINQSYLKLERKYYLHN